MVTLLILSSVACILSIVSLICNKYCSDRVSTIQFTLSIVALIFAFIAIAVALPREVNINVEMDYLGVICAVLSILFTIMIGWQLYSVFRIKDDVSATTKASKEAKKASRDANKATEDAKKATERASDIQKDIEKSKLELSGLKTEYKSMKDKADETNQKSSEALLKAQKSLDETNRLNEKIHDVLAEISINTAQAILAKTSAENASESVNKVKEEILEKYDQILKVNNLETNHKSDIDHKRVEVILLLALAELYIKDSKSKEEADSAFSEFKERMEDWKKRAENIVNPPTQTPPSLPEK